MMKISILAVFLAFAFQLLGTAQNGRENKQKSVPYTWKNVQIVGGGFVDGIIFHPFEKGLRYCRTDMGGAYRWNERLRRWEPLMDWVSYKDYNLMGVESIALDPSNPDLLYLACGTYTTDRGSNGAILRSADRGKTFQRTNLPFKMGGNENGRGNGERMAVDPNDGNILYLGTRKAGLWRSTDRGVNWSKVESFPDVSDAQNYLNPDEWGKQEPGIVMVVFDPSEGVKGQPNQTIYVAVSLMGRDNLFVSKDAGKTWSPVKGQPVQYRPTHAVLASDGMLYLTYGDNPGPYPMTNGGVWKFNTKNEEWTDITPDKPAPEQNKKFGYAAVSVDAQSPQTLIVSSYYRPGKSGGDDIFRSTDGGKSWKPIFKSGSTFDYSLAPYVAHTPLHWFFDIEIDPADPDHAMFTTGYGGWETFNLTALNVGQPVKWSIMATGIEETVPLALLSPPKGVQLFTAVGDYCGFAHTNLDKPQPEGCFLNPHFGNTNDIACAEKNPDVIVRVGKASSHIPGAHIGYSLDGGKTWQPPVSVPDKESKLGFIAVSTDGTSWVWTPERSASYVTHDKGATWNLIKSLPDNIRVIADKVNPNKFYGIDLFKGKFFVSQDKGNDFNEQTLNLPGGYPKSRNNRGDDRGGQDKIYSTPGYEGDLWIAAFDGLYHSTNTGKIFIRLDGVQEMHGFGFGKAAPRSKYPALYMVGTINGQRGIFRSDDAAKSWIRINDDQHQWGLILHVTGDPKKYGRVYVGTHGRGTVYGDPKVK